jgi:sec-independent protein translocase protein TatC
MKYIKYLTEIKLRFFYIFFSFISSFIINYYYCEELLFIVIKPLLIYNEYFIFTELSEIFFTYIEIVLIATFYFLFPLCCYHFWSFIECGLFYFERKLFKFLLLISLTLSILSIFFSYFIVIPQACFFFTHFEMTNSFILLEPRIYNYIIFISNILFNFILIAQLPLILIIAIKLKIIKKINRRYSYFLAILIATLLSTPDLISQLFLFIPIIFSFELILIILELNKYYHKLQKI